MALYEWKPSYSVKVKSCDAEHLKLFGLINDLHQAMHERKGAEIIDIIVADLERYTQVHFTAEEALMAWTNYPGLAAHRSQHKMFIDRVAEFRQTGLNGQSIAVLTFLNDWLTNHILRIDKQYSDHLNAHGVC